MHLHELQHDKYRDIWTDMTVVQLEDYINRIRQYPESDVTPTVNLNDLITPLGSIVPEDYTRRTFRLILVYSHPASIPQVNLEAFQELNAMGLIVDVVNLTQTVYRSDDVPPRNVS